MNKEVAGQIIGRAIKEGRKMLSEFEAKQVVAAYSIPVARDILVRERSALASALREIGYPLVMKGCSAALAHKTEKNLVRVDIRSDDEAFLAYEEITAALELEGGGAVLVQEMVRGRRELVAGLTRDPQFGPCVMFGLGGIFTEILRDIVFRKAPLAEQDAYQMMNEIRGRKILDSVRGMEAADRPALAKMLIALGTIGLEIEEVAEIDLNPVILQGTKPVAVDALIILK